MSGLRNSSGHARRSLSRSAAAVAGALGLLVLTSACKLDTVVFGAEKTEAYVLPQTVVPDSLRREVTFPSGGETLRGYWLRQPGTSARLTVVFSHGKGEHLAGDTEWSHAEFLWQSGFDVLTYDYRGFGRSTGTSVDEITLATDARSALTFALTQPGVTLGRTVSYGHSLGSAPAIALASTTPGLRALVIEAGFSNGQAMAESAVPMGIPVSWLLREPMQNTQRIAQVQTPVLVMHGDDDRLIPIAQGRDLHAAARDPKQFRLVAGAGHDNVPQTLGVTAFRSLLRTFTGADVP
jgi:pimeloyl-ACP methyl ester carboxylesterase